MEYNPKYVFDDDDDLLDSNYPENDIVQLKRIIASKDITIAALQKMIEDKDERIVILQSSLAELSKSISRIDDSLWRYDYDTDK